MCGSLWLGLDEKVSLLFQAQIGLPDLLRFLLWPDPPGLWQLVSYMHTLFAGPHVGILIGCSMADSPSAPCGIAPMCSPRDAPVESKSGLCTV